MQVTRRRACAVASLVLGAASFDTAVASSSRATEATPAISIVSTPNVQTLETRIIPRLDAKTHRWMATLDFGAATFRIVVTNHSTVEVTGVAVDSSASASCNRRIASLAPGASLAYTCHAASVGRNFTNRLAASGNVPDDVNTSDAPVRLATANAAPFVMVKAPRRSRIPHFNVTHPAPRRSRIPHLPLATG